MTRSIVILCLFLIGLTGFCQDTLKTINNSDHGEPIDCCCYEKEWDHFKLVDTIVVTIMDHLTAPTSCDFVKTASMTIAKTEKGDTIRIFDMCNKSNKYRKGQIIKVAPSYEPQLIVLTPIVLTKNPKTNKFETSIFYSTVLKTTWGDLLDK